MPKQYAFDLDGITRVVPSRLTEDASAWGARMAQGDLELWAHERHLLGPPTGEECDGELEDLAERLIGRE